MRIALDEGLFLHNVGGVPIRFSAPVNGSSLYSAS